MESIGNVDHVRGTRVRTDRILPETRWLAVLIIPFLVAASILLFIWPNDTDKLFAWTIIPAMTPMMLAAAYLGGIYFFARVFLAKQWHLVKLGFLPVTVFASLLGIATILHWDRFNHSHISFYVWALLYFTTPFLVFVVWLRNRMADPGSAEPGEVIIPPVIRLFIGVTGVITLAVGLLLFLQPLLMISTWPWQLTPLTTRVMGALFALTGVGELGIALDVRWSAARIALQSQMIGIVAISVAIVFSWNNFHQANPLTWVFIASILFLLIASPLLYIWMEMRGKIIGGAA